MSKGRRELAYRATIKKAGINPYVDVPKRVSEALDLRGTIPVAGTIDGATFRSTLVPLGAGRHRLYVNGAMREASQVDVGDRVAIVLWHDDEARELPVPDQLARALGADDRARAVWDSWQPSRRKEVLAYLNSLKTTASVERNVERLLGRLRLQSS